MSAEESKAASKEETTMSAEESKVGSEKMREVDQTRRALIKAGWVIPVVLAVQLPTPPAAFASSASVDATATVETEPVSATVTVGATLP